jgi:lipoprotein-anchoring transpeptidase ErfK/SrfK
VQTSQRELLPPPEILPAGAQPPIPDAYERGIELYSANKLIEARSRLSEAYFSGLLDTQKQEDARRKLEELAEITLIGVGSPVYPDDPYAGHYEVRPGEALTAIERKLKLHIPWQLVLRVNNMLRPEDLEAGRRYKVVHGPFHAVVNKSAFIMDVYLHREGQEKIFIKRFAIGIGVDGSTPVGMWRVKLGGKQERPTWYPPPNSPLRGPISYGHPDYAFGEKGLWIGLAGMDENTQNLTDYGIHSTNDQSSIGRAESLGCIRLADGDIDLVYSLLYEHWSTVEVRP